MRITKLLTIGITALLALAIMISCGGGGGGDGSGSGDSDSDISNPLAVIETNLSIANDTAFVESDYDLKNISMTLTLDDMSSIAVTVLSWEYQPGDGSMTDGTIYHTPASPAVVLLTATCMYNGKEYSDTLSLSVEFSKSLLSLSIGKSWDLCRPGQSYDLSKLDVTANYDDGSSGVVNVDWSVISGGGVIENNVFTAPTTEETYALRAEYTLHGITESCTIYLSDATLMALNLSDDYSEIDVDTVFDFSIVDVRATLSSGFEWYVTPELGIVMGGGALDGLNFIAPSVAGETIVSLSYTLGETKSSDYTLRINSDDVGATWEQTVYAADFSHRYGHSSVVFDDKMWIIGGNVDWNKNSDVWFSSDGENWETATDDGFSPGREEHSSVVFDGYIWVIAGMSLSANLNDVWRSENGVDWELVTDNAFPKRKSHQTIVYDNKMWVIGGYGYNSSSTGYEWKNDVWYSQDGISWTEAIDHAAFSSRDGHTALVFDDKMWIIGGWCLTELNDVWSSSDGITWEKVTDNAAFSPRQYHTSVVYDDAMWVMSGWDSNDNPLNDLWRSTDGQTWTPVSYAAHFCKRWIASSLVYDGKMWIIGGFTKVSGLRDVWCSISP